VCRFQPTSPCPPPEGDRGRIPLFGRAVKDLPVMKQFYAHSANSQGQKHRLSGHLKEVVALSKKYDNKFSARDRAYWEGLWQGGIDA